QHGIMPQVIEHKTSKDREQQVKHSQVSGKTNLDKEKTPGPPPPWQSPCQSAPRGQSSHEKRDDQGHLLIDRTLNYLINEHQRDFDNYQHRPADSRIQDNRRAETAFCPYQQ